MGIVIVLIIIVVGIWLMTRSSGTDDTNLPPVSPQTSVAPTAKPVDNTPAGAISSSGTSDTALNLDAAAIDAQMNGLSTDTTAAQTTTQ